ncbi:MAG: cation:proton antiporter, partial [Bacteroidaceae bacterium]|nr:cation:proton antiporter [Bacteroidaceae bacterium]
MDSLQPLIVDLALILILAGIVTLVFKRLHQPVVLGYIVAGFLAGPNFHYLPSIADTENIDVWAQIGIIVLLFTLGLEFNFKKLLNVGGTAFTTAITIAVGMIAIGYMAGQFLGFTVFDSIFLGAMLSMSSTMIIIKAFGDLGLQQQKFTQTVFGVLIVQDLLAVVLLVVLSSVATGSVEGGELLHSVARLVFFLVLWFVIGTYIIPTFVRSVRRFLNNETLLIVAMGLCFGMVVIATYAGFSSALGAFVMGSILSSANEVERIGRVMQPIKDLFGAIFFISVGMLVNVDTLLQYSGPILLLSLVVIIGQPLLAIVAMLLSGQPLNTAIKSGFSLSQIGEFSFIIATLGISLGVINPTLYPIVVAVSVVT